MPGFDAVLRKVLEVDMHTMMNVHGCLEFLVGVVMIVGRPDWVFGVIGNGISPAVILLMRWLGCAVICGAAALYMFRDNLPTKRKSGEVLCYTMALYHTLVTAVALAHRSDFTDLFIPVLIPAAHGLVGIGFATAAMGNKRDYSNLHLTPPNSYHKNPPTRRIRLNSRPVERHDIEVAMEALVDSECSETSSEESVYESQTNIPVEASFSPEREDSSMGKYTSCLSEVTLGPASPATRNGSLLPRSFANELTPYTESEPIVGSGWELDLEGLSRGGAVFSFSCKAGAKLPDHEQEMLSLFINMSSGGNYCPHIDMADPAELAQHTFFLTRAVYTLPSVALQALSPATLSSIQYQKACQPAKTKVWTDCMKHGDLDTFRITKSIVPMLFSMTVQFKCSLIPDYQLERLTALTNGYAIDKGILLERTTRTGKADMTKTCKSLLLYHSLGPRGVLVFNPTAIANTSLPGVFASIIDRLGALGSKEAAETATKTRLYFAN